jgi:hypothetical protein
MLGLTLVASKGFVQSCQFLKMAGLKTLWIWDILGVRFEHLVTFWFMNLAYYRPTRLIPPSLKQKNAFSIEGVSAAWSKNLPPFMNPTFLHCAVSNAHIDVCFLLCPFMVSVHCDTPAYTKFWPHRTSNIATSWSPWKHTFYLGYVVVGILGYTYERHGCTLPELITFSLSIITFSLSRTTVEVSHVGAGEHMVPGPFHSSSS